MMQPKRRCARFHDGVRNLDVVTATLDGVRTQLLGLPVSDGLRVPPMAPPCAIPRRLPRLTRCWLGASPSPARACWMCLAARWRCRGPPSSRPRAPRAKTVPVRGGCPALLRPSRWLLRLVDAATLVGAEGQEARVDQIEADLQINPVAGFVMPDHLDESLEVFGVDGVPIGELLHEVTSGGVMWEIAAGPCRPCRSRPAV